jgi:hypothetical protein
MKLFTINLIGGYEIGSGIIAEFPRQILGRIAKDINLS